MHRVKARVKYGVTGVRTGILFPSLHLNFPQDNLCCLCRVCVLTPSPPQNLSEKKWIDGSTLRSSRCCGCKGPSVHTLIWSSVSCLCNWERAELFCCVYGPGSQCEWLKSILVKLASDWVQKRQEKMQGSLSHKASSVLTPRWKMVIPALNASQVLFPKSCHPLASRDTSHNDSFPLP